MSGQIQSTELKHWHATVPNELRQHLVHTIVQSIIPGTQKATLIEPRLQNVVNFARSIEEDFYAASSSRSEYYRCIADKVYQFVKEMENIREGCRNQDIYEDITDRLARL
ncbi:histone acetyltransferase p300-like [Pectinophora gossypiella]|uniref:histone acetyltransferase p300-like n=1 Tax=Pectinophora gossypiella TaxID=13191 RepID=UPI00214E48E9|nr:histone acetyltransferase p300-like [Pectinophora gossypiella]